MPVRNTAAGRAKPVYKIEGVECVPGNRVLDRWYPELGTGRIVACLKTRVLIDFPRGTNRKSYAGVEYTHSYDRAHLMFLHNSK